jgi:hypothetical protein
MKRRSGKRSSCVGSEKMERVVDRQGQIERYFSTDQSPQRAVAPTEEDTGLFISPSGTFELRCATTKTDTAERSI